MKQKNSLPAVFLTPAMGILAVLALVPTAYAIYISFQNRELSRPDGSFVGFANYIDLFSDRRFVNAIGVSLTWEAVTVGMTSSSPLASAFCSSNACRRARAICWRCCFWCP